MFTRCQACHTVHPVNAALLARAGGRFRCGKCKKVGNALEALFDQWPDAGAAPPASGNLPELGAPLRIDPAPADPATPEESALPADPDSAPHREPPGTRRWLRYAWLVAAVALIIVAGWRLASYFGFSVPDQRLFESALERAGLKDPPPEPPFRDLGKIEIVSREMIAHPNRPAVLLLNATLINRAGRAQPYPIIDVLLRDLDNRVIAQHRFAPAEYLSRTAGSASDMAPDAYVGLSLELPDPGEQAVGFELEFR